MITIIILLLIIPILLIAICMDVILLIPISLIAAIIAYPIKKIREKRKERKSYDKGTEITCRSCVDSEN